MQQQQGLSQHEILEREAIRFRVRGLEFRFGDFDVPITEIIPEKAKTNMVGMISKEEHERIIENLKKQYENELSQIKSEAGKYLIQGYDVLNKEMEQVANWKHAFEMSKRLEASKSQQLNRDKSNDKGMGR